MNETAHQDPSRLLQLARDGDEVAVGRLLEVYRDYLRMLARLEVDRRLRGKVDASDLVQEAFLQACRSFKTFRGTTEGELTVWLRKILASKVANLVRRYYKTQSRDVRLERQFDEELDRSSQAARAFALSQSAPSQKAVRREQSVLLADALGRLPADYREVIVLHHLEQLTFLEVARHMERSVDGTKKLWARSLAALRRTLGGEC